VVKGAQNDDEMSAIEVLIHLRQMQRRGIWERLTSLFSRRRKISLAEVNKGVDALFSWVMWVERVLDDMLGRMWEEIAAVIGWGAYFNAMLVPEGGKVLTRLPCVTCLREGRKYHTLHLVGDELLCEEVKVRLPARAYSSSLFSFLGEIKDDYAAQGEIISLWEAYVANFIASKEVVTAENALADFRRIFYSLTRGLSPCSIDASEVGFVNTVLVYTLYYGKVAELFFAYEYESALRTLHQHILSSPHYRKVLFYTDKLENLSGDREPAWSDMVRLEARRGEELGKLMASFSEEDFNLFILSLPFAVR